MSEDKNSQERQEDRAREALYKKIDEELKILADLKRYTFTALLAVVVGTVSTDQKLPRLIGFGVGLSLFFAFCVLVIVRYRKLKKYKDD